MDFEGADGQYADDASKAAAASNSDVLDPLCRFNNLTRLGINRVLSKRSRPTDWKIGGRAPAMLLAYIHKRKGKNPEGAPLGSLVTAFHDVYPGKKREPTVWVGAYLHRLIETVYIYIYRRRRRLQ